MLSSPARLPRLEVMFVSHAWLAHNLEAALLCTPDLQLHTGPSHGKLLLLSSAQNCALCQSELAPQHLCITQMVWIQLMLSLEQVVQKHNSREPLLQQRFFFQQLQLLICLRPGQEKVNNQTPFSRKASRYNPFGLQHSF